MEKIKYISFKTNVGNWYKVPLDYVAKDRAIYYAIEGNVLNTKLYKSEYDLVMKNNYEGIDWMINNMNFEKIKPCCTMIDTLKIKEDFENSTENIEIIEE